MVIFVSLDFVVPFIFPNLRKWKCGLCSVDVKDESLKPEVGVA